MELDINSAISALKKRDKSIKSLDSKCYKLSRLARTLVSALEDTIKHDEMSYDDRRAMTEETKSICNILETVDAQTQPVDEKF
jgi:predicted transcriptional regulator